MWLGFYVADVYSGVRVFNGDTDIDAVFLFCFFYSKDSGVQLLEGSLHTSLFLWVCCCWQICTPYHGQLQCQELHCQEFSGGGSGEFLLERAEDSLLLLLLD